MAAEMELSEQVTGGLQILSSPARISDKCLANLIDSVFHNLLVANSSQVSFEDIVKKESVDRAAAKEAYGALAVLVVEAAKHDLSSTTLSSLLEECHVSPERNTYIVEAFQKNKNDLRVKLGSIGNFLPRIVDVDWRLDYCIKSDLLEKINEPKYLINLKTQKSGEQQLENVQFTCTLEQLQDLVGKLKEAVKCVEKASQL